MKHKETIDNVVIWNTSVLKEAFRKNDILVQVQSYVVSEICNPHSQKGSIPFEEILTQKPLEDFIKSSPSLCIEFLILLKKYRLDLYEKEATDLVDIYESLLEDIWKDQPTNIDLFFMLNMMHQLKGTSPEFKNTRDITVSEDSFLLQSKVVIEKHLNELLVVSHYGLHHITLPPATVEAIETILIDYATKYDLVLVSKALRVLSYAKITNTYITKLVSDFLLHNQAIEGYIGHYDPEFVKTKTEHLAQSQRLQITKEIIISILEYSSDYRYIRDFSR